MPRSLGPWGATAIVVGITIGTGIFRVPATVAAQLHAVGPAMVCWLLGGLISLCGALSVAELGAALPRSGGIFAYLLECYGPLPAFLYGWACLTVVTPAAGLVKFTCQIALPLRVLASKAYTLSCSVAAITRLW